MSLLDGTVEILYIVIPALVMGWLHRSRSAKRGT